jgi:hypothetical protein
MPTPAGICGAKRAFLSRLEIGSELCFVGVAETLNRGVSIRFWRLEARRWTLKKEEAADV